MLDELQKIFEETTGNYSLKLTPKTELTDELTGSSYGKIQLICAIEDYYGIEIPNSALRSFKKISDIMLFLEKNK